VIPVSGGSAAGPALAFNAAQLLVAVIAFRLDREPLGPLWALPLQQSSTAR
jgi:hypothetical protein